MTDGRFSGIKYQGMRCLDNYDGLTLSKELMAFKPFFLLALTLSSSHLKLALVKVAQILLTRLTSRAGVYKWTVDIIPRLGNKD